ncbi:MAG: metallophosphoesterase family protein [Burkholderiaceae bacterium]
MQRIGLISDTHGLLRAEAVAFLQGCDRIVHAGDICDPAVLEALARIAPVDAVRGNNDRGAWADAIVERLTIRIEDVALLAIHDLADLSTTPRGVTIVVHGHSHKPTTVARDGVLYVNPGSAGPRRFRLPISIGELRIDGAKTEVNLVTLIA